MQSIRASEPQFPLVKPIFKTARADPSRLALVSSDFVVTYQELARFISTYARRLQLRGVTHSSCLALSLTDDVSAICASLAATLIGCRCLVLTTELALKESQAVPTHVLHDNYKHNTDLGNIICVGPWQFDADIEPKNIEKFGFQGYEKPTDIWRIANSSGSTGTPKFIGLSEQAILRQLKYFSPTRSQRSATRATLFRATSYPGLNLICSVLVNSGTAILFPTTKLLSEYKPEIVLGSPAQLSDLLQNEPNQFPRKLPCLIVGGAQLNSAFAELALSRFDRLINGYGSTEAGWIALTDIESAEGPFSVGRPLDDAQVEIVDTMDTPLPPGEEGIIRTKTQFMAQEYLYDDNNMSAEVFRNGWFYSGDAGYLNDNGEIFITGRIRDTLNLGGVKVSAQLIDDQLMSVEGVADCLAFSEIDETSIASISVLLVAKTGHSEDRIIDILLDTYAPKLPLQHIPVRLYFAQNVPRNANGKAMRHKAIEVARLVEPVRFKELVLKKAN